MRLIAIVNVLLCSFWFSILMLRCTQDDITPNNERLQAQQEPIVVPYDSKNVVINTDNDNMKKVAIKKEIQIITTDNNVKMVHAPENSNSVNIIISKTDKKQQSGDDIILSDIKKLQDLVNKTYKSIK